MSLASINKVLLELSHLLLLSYNRLILFLVRLYYHQLSHEPLLESHFSSKSLRIPKHIALAFTNEADNLDLDSISRILSWCKQLSIDHVTLYDDQGRLKARRKDLIRQLKSDEIDGLKIISRPDGRLRFIEQVRELVKYEPSSISLELVQERVGWSSDPELLLNFGYPMCLYGFPPWQLRLTEILSIPTHRKLPQKVFLDSLRRYSRISQREGV